MTFILPSFGASAISAVPASGGGGGGGGALTNQYSLDFDGTDDYVDTGSTFQSTFQSDHSISFWVKRSRSSLESFGGILDGTSGARHYFFADGSTLRLYYYTASGLSITVSGSVTWNTTDWFHVAGTVEQSGSDAVVKVYLDGSLVSSTTATGSLSGYTSTLDYVIGKRNRPGSSEIPYQGLIDEFAIIPSALSASQITNIYRGEDDGGSGGTNGVPGDLDTFNPVGWWRMGDDDSGTGTTITDQGSGGNDGTLTNGPTFSTTVPS